MAFELPEVTQVAVVAANVRSEFHGDEHVRAIDIRFSITGENMLLDLIKPGLREHHYWNKAATAGQEALPDVVIPLPNLRHPELPMKIRYANGQKWRGYRFLRDYGTDEDRIDFTDCAFGNIEYELKEGGSVTIWGTVSYNGDELNDNALYGELSGLATESEIHVKLLAPPDLKVAKKGAYRAGKPDTAANTSNPNQGELQDGNDSGDDAGDEDDDKLPPDSPEGALAATSEM